MDEGNPYRSRQASAGAIETTGAHILETVVALSWENCMIRSIRSGSSFLVGAISIVATCAAPSASAADDIVTLDIGGYRFNARNDISVGGPTSRGTSFRIER